MRLSANRRRRLLKLGSVLVLLLAVAPQVLYLGHPRSADDSAATARALPPGHENHAEEAAAKHANHCHVGPKGCAASDGVVHIASFNAVIEILEHDGSVSAVDATPLPRSFVLWQRPEKPPQPV